MALPTLRRYLQPSPTLRWHPWAPLLVMLLALVAALVFGARLGYWYAVKDLDSAYLQAFLAKVRIQEQAERPSMAAVREVRNLDNAVVAWANPPRGDLWQRTGTYLHDALNKPAPAERMRAAVVQIAEFRLREFAPASPRWHADADWCDATFSFPGPVAARFEREAVAYTKLLGRPISPRDLAPAIPGGECRFKQGGRQ